MNDICCKSTIVYLLYMTCIIMLVWGQKKGKQRNKWEPTVFLIGALISDWPFLKVHNTML